MSFGLPILTTNKKPMQDIVYDEGVIFDIDNPKSLETTIIENINEEKLVKISKENYILSKKYIVKDSVRRSIKFICDNV